jgi:elongation factor P hydroxylase
MMNADDLCRVFNAEFADIHTRLVSGAEEPLYLPDTGQGASIHFRSNFPSSAMHEISHWCIAGSERRKLVDFGYWYAPDGRNASQQNEFYGLEVKPQALEWIFSDAAGIKFNISADNLGGEDLGELDVFTSNVIKQKQEYLGSGLPTRARRFLNALLQCRQTRSNQAFAVATPL